MCRLFLVFAGLAALGFGAGAFRQQSSASFRAWWTRAWLPDRQTLTILDVKKNTEAEMLGATVRGAAAFARFFEALSNQCSERATHQELKQCSQKVYHFV